MSSYCCKQCYPHVSTHQAIPFWPLRPLVPAGAVVGALLTDFLTDGLALFVAGRCRRRSAEIQLLRDWLFPSDIVFRSALWVGVTSIRVDRRGLYSPTRYSRQLIVCDRKRSVTLCLEIDTVTFWYSSRLNLWKFDADCCHMDTAIKHPVPDRVKSSFCNFWHPNRLLLWRSARSVRVPGCKNYKWRLNPVLHRMFYSCTHMATVGVKGLIYAVWAV